MAVHWVRSMANIEILVRHLKMKRRLVGMTEEGKSYLIVLLDICVFIWKIKLCFYKKQQK